MNEINDTLIDRVINLTLEVHKLTERVKDLDAKLSKPPSDERLEKLERAVQTLRNAEPLPSKGTFTLPGAKS